MEIKITKRERKKKERNLSPQPILDSEILTNFLREHDVKPIHARGIIKHFIQNDGKCSFKDIPNIPPRIHELLEKNFAYLTTTLVEEHKSTDGTVKLLVQLQDGHRVESVIMKHETLKKTSRNTLCVSSQVGCAMACTFCATGTMGFKADLTAGEICEQLVYANRVAPIRNIVFMGMGEPLDNYQAVLSAIKMMSDTSGFNLAPRHITVSTVGIVPKIIQITNDAPSVNLALSLHAPTHELRKEIVPTARSYPLNEIMNAIDYHIEKTGNRIFVEYVLIGDVNDSPETAALLGNLLKDRNCVINIIPYNQTDVKDKYRSPTTEEAKTFLEIVQKTSGRIAVIRKTHGDDVAGACGQLVVQKEKKSTCKGSDIEDLLGSKDNKHIALKKSNDNPTIIPTNNNASKKLNLVDHLAFKFLLAIVGIFLFFLFLYRLSL